MKISSFDLNLFVVMNAIYTEGSLTKAAEVVGITQPAVSNALARLREKFDDELFIRQKDIYDGAMPSGNSVAAENLYYLGRLAEIPAWETLSHKIGQTFSDQVKRAPRGFTALLQTVQAQVNGTREIVISGEESDLREGNQVLRQFYDPFKLILHRPNEGYEAIEDIAGFLSYQKAIDGGFTAYICENYACQYPSTDIPSFESSLKELLGK